MMSLGLRFLLVSGKFGLEQWFSSTLAVEQNLPQRHSMQHAYTPRVEGEIVMQTGVV